MSGGLGPVKFSEYDERDSGSYVAFARAQFGPRAYQASRSYLEWLYRHNPATRGYRDFLLARTGDGRVVGCIHKLVLPWQVDGRAQPLPTLHNLMVDPAYRSGAGLFLLLAAVRGEPYAVIPGVVGELSQAYRRLRGYRPIPSFWYRAVLRPVRVASCLGRARLGLGSPDCWLPAEVDRVHEGCRVRTRPDAEGVARVTRQLLGDGNGFRVLWSDALVTWRFFSAAGPRHALIESDDGRSFAVVAFGPRHGVPVARLVAWSFDGDGRRFLAQLRRISRRLGAGILLALSACESDRQALDRAGWQPLDDPPDTYVYAKSELPAVSFGAAPTDYGLESFPP